MQKQLLIFLGVLFFIGKSAAQDCTNLRYEAAIFDSIVVSSDILYGAADPYDILGWDNSEDLYLDLYEPAGDSLMQRPLVIMHFGGAFVAGWKDYVDMIAWGDSLARHGYVVVSPDYRLGFNFLSGDSGVRAVYRAIQDSRAVVRYMKEYHEAYRIDTTKIYMGGNSAGSITAINTAFLNTEADRPTATYGVGGLADGDDLGCLDCSGNDYQHSVEVVGLINLWGAVYDTLFMDSSELIPMVHVHGTDDGTVPFGVEQPFGGLFPFPTVYGSEPMHQRLQNLGVYDEFYPYEGLGHAFYLNGLSMNEYWDTIFVQGRDFLWHTLQFDSPNPEGETLVCVNDEVVYSIPETAGSSYCWMVENGTIVAQDEATITVLWEEENVLGSISVTETNYNEITGERTSIDVEVLSYPEVGFEWENEYEFFEFSYPYEGALSWHWDFGDGTTSEEQNPAHLFEAGTYEVTLTVSNTAGCEIIYSQMILAEPNGLMDINTVKNNLQLFPNPTKEVLNIAFTSTNNRPITIKIYDAIGRLVQEENVTIASGANSLEVLVEALISGIYMVQLEQHQHVFSGRFVKE